MSEVIFTVLMIAVTSIMFVIIYLLPIAGIIIGVILLKTKPKNNWSALAITIISTIIFITILILKILDFIKV